MAKMFLNPDFKEFIGLLNANSVKYLVVGAYAVAIHGFVRNTGDLDIWIEPSVKNAGQIMALGDLKIYPKAKRVDHGT